MIEPILIGFAITLGAASFSSFIYKLLPASLLNRVTLIDMSQPRIFSSGIYLRKLSQIASRKSKRTTQALYELPDFINLIAVGVAAGGSLHSVLSAVTQRANGVVAEEFRVLLKALELGSTLEQELKALSARLPETQLTEFCNKLSISLQRGTPLSNLLNEQVRSVRSEIQIQKIKQAGKNETRMMIPLVFLILPITVLFAVFPSLSYLNIQII